MNHSLTHKEESKTTRMRTDTTATKKSANNNQLSKKISIKQD